MWLQHSWQPFQASDNRPAACMPLRETGAALRHVGRATCMHTGSCTCGWCPCAHVLRGAGSCLTREDKKCQGRQAGPGCCIIQQGACQLLPGVHEALDSIGGCAALLPKGAADCRVGQGAVCLAADHACTEQGSHKLEHPSAEHRSQQYELAPTEPMLCPGHHCGCRLERFRRCPTLNP